MKLGETLVKKGVLTEAQLEETLKAQLMFGGHLGTCLIESGLVTEDTLGEALQSVSGVQYAASHLLQDIPQSTIKAVPRRIAEEYKAVPFRLEGNAIHLALVNPKDPRALEVLGFTTGRTIVPWIAPEVRVLQALERYYGVERRARYIKLDYILAGMRQPNALRGQAVPVAPAEDFGFLSSLDSELSFGYGRPWQEVAEELFQRDSAEPDPEHGPISLSDLSERYCRSDSRDDIARAALDFMAGRARRTLLMFVRKNWASVWMERGYSIPDNARDEVKFDVTSEPLFGTLLGSDHYYGPLPGDAGVHSFFDRLGVAPSPEILLIPVHVNDLLIAAVLADGGPTGRIEGELDDFLKAFRLFSSTVVMVALRKNLRDVARPIVPA